MIFNMPLPNKAILFLLLFYVGIFSKTLTVASYNVENLFDIKFDGTEYDVYTEKGGWNLSSYRTKLKNIAFVISEIDADIIYLQEIAKKTALEDLKKRLARSGVKYKYSSFEKTGRHAVGVGLLSKYPIVKTKRHPVVNSRPIMRCDIAIDADTLSVFTVHFPAKRHPESERIKAANALKRAIDTLLAGENYEYFVAGDFNSDFDEFAKSLSQGTDNTKGRTGINHVLKTLRSPVGQTPILSIAPLAEGEHYNPWNEVDLEDRWTYIYRGNKNSLDHILFPQSMTDSVGYRYIYGSFSHYSVPKIINDGKPYSWQHSRIGRHYDAGFSDHLAVTAKISNENISQETPQENEIGLDGWLTNHSLAKLSLVGRMPQGHGIYELTGKKIPATATVAKITAVADRDYKTMEMALRGLGTVTLRCRINSGEGDNKWTYISPLSQESSGQAKYLDFKSEEWIYLPLLSGVSTGDVVEIEIRVQKDKAYRLQFCVEDLKGWRREGKTRKRD